MNKLYLVFLAILFLLINGCRMFYPQKNYEEAIVTKKENIYEIQIKSREFADDHNLMGLLGLGHAYVDTTTIPVPRIQGLVSGNEISVPDGQEKWFGNITFYENRAVVDLYWGSIPNQSRVPCPCNGQYILKFN